MHACPQHLSTQIKDYTCEHQFAHAVTRFAQVGATLHHTGFALGPVGVEDAQHGTEVHSIFSSVKWGQYLPISVKHYGLDSDSRHSPEQGVVCKQHCLLGLFLGYLASHSPHLCHNPSPSFALSPEGSTLSLVIPAINYSPPCSGSATLPLSRRMERSLYPTGIRERVRG